MENRISPLISSSKSKMFLVADGKEVKEEPVNRPKTQDCDSSQDPDISQEYIVGTDGEKMTVYIENTDGNSKPLNLNYHHHGEDTKSRFKCWYCNQATFANRSNLLRHISSAHSNERPFNCNECGAAFAQNSNLVKHQLIHTGQRPFTCHFCNRAFSQRANLKKHLLIHTGERPYTCSFCHRGFAQQTNLDKHERIHTGDRPYVCKICAKGFAQQNNLVKHMFTHEPKKPFSCQNCNKSYTQKLNLEKHEKNCIKITIVM